MRRQPVTLWLELRGGPIRHGKPPPACGKQDAGIGWRRLMGTGKASKLKGFEAFLLADYPYRLGYDAAKPPMVSDAGHSRFDKAAAYVDSDGDTLCQSCPSLNRSSRSAPTAPACAASLPSRRCALRLASNPDHPAKTTDASPVRPQMANFVLQSSATLPGCVEKLMSVPAPDSTAARPRPITADRVPLPERGCGPAGYSGMHPEKVCWSALRAPWCGVLDRAGPFRSRALLQLTIQHQRERCILPRDLQAVSRVKE